MADESMPEMRIDGITTNSGNGFPHLLQVQIMSKYPDDGGATRRYYTWFAIIAAILIGLAIAAFLPFFL